MEIQFREADSVTIAEIAGSVDGLTAGDLLSRMAERLKAGGSRLVADFRGVEYISSAGLRALLATMKDARLRGGDLRLGGLRPEVKRVLELSGFTSILKIYDDAGAAAASFAG
jgi:anti-anti-sigma factor